ncbi:MAG: preprotein translocase subunit SecE [Peptococcaceae bacterium]|nr:preprotein translocase subunit SecE [Peptococcaceae bacterium]
MAFLKKPEKEENGLTVQQTADKKKAVVKKDGLKADGKKAATVKQDKVSSVVRLKAYFRGVYSELKKVHWPTRREVLIYTAVVVVAVIIVGALIWVFDAGMSRVLQLIIR